MSVVEEVLRLGDDALANQWICIFPSGIPGGGNAENISMRMDQQFDIPQQVLYLYNLEYRGDIIRKTGKKIDTSKEFVVSVRVDQMWKVYDDLMRWQKLAYDPVTNTAMPDAMTRAPITIQNIDGSNKVVKNFKFTQCKLYGSKITSFDHQSGDPLRVELSFIYGDFDDSVTI
jgi:hypothetical protein